MTISIDRDGGVAVVTVDNPPVNALGRALRQALWDAVGTLDADPDVRAVVLICAGRTFIAGADVSEFDRPPEPPHLPDLVRRIEDAAKPWVAAIHGSALGGGLEVAMGCRLRVALATASVGLPEVTLGIVPGAGGTVRTPRLVGVDAAVEMVTGGKPVRAARAHAIGLIDRVVEGDLRTAAVAFAREAIEQPLPAMARQRKVAPPAERFWAEAEARVRKTAKGAEAPLRALACLRRGVEAPFDEAMAFERETFLDLRASDQAAALRHVFFAERAATRPADLKGVEPRSITKAGVIGGGTMGAGIAAALRDAGIGVVLVERDEAVLAASLERLRGIFDGAATRGRLTEAEARDRMAGVEGATDYAALAEADLVVEAVFEDLDVKREVFARLARACRPDAILATNTSYLDPRLVAEGLPQPERFLGLHFFSPANIMKLLEIVPTPATAPEVLATAFALAARLRKVPVRAGICDGFIGNRILKATRTQAERLVLAGVEPVDLDAAMRRFGLAMGPFEVQDLAGLDIAASQRKAARARGETPFAPIADRLVAAGRIGRKAGRGWYDYQGGVARGEAAAETMQIVAEERARAGSAEAIPGDPAEVMLAAMVSEGAAILAEGIAASPADIDLVKIHGYGFPRWRGGPMHWAERRGLDSLVATLDTLAARGQTEPPSEALRAAARRGAFS